MDGATLLPIDQLILTISQDVFTEPSDLALAQKIAAMLERASRTNLGWGLGEFAIELESISKNQSKISGFSDEDLGFDPDVYKGKVLVTTIHKAKGLEWDRVYLLSANNYDFPSLQSYDQYVSEKWFIRDQINLQAEAIESLQRFSRGIRFHSWQNRGVPHWKLDGNIVQSGYGCCLWVLPGQEKSC